MTSASGQELDASSLGGGQYMDGVEQLMKDVSDSLERLEQKLETQQKELN